jgi:hypothetical protein
MVKAVFEGKSLDRVELISNWDNRPLRHHQLQFAGTEQLSHSDSPSHVLVGY